jgi:hypothetical protein
MNGSHFVIHSLMNSFVTMAMVILWHQQNISHAAKWMEPSNAEIALINISAVIIASLKLTGICLYIRSRLVVVSPCSFPLLMPTHLLQEWTGKFFAKIMLKALGLCFQLGHGRSHCPLPAHRPSNFMVFDTTGVHDVTMDICDCHQSILHQHTQLLHAHWFPTTVNQPKTVFTFDCLNIYHELSLQGKTTAFDFYHIVLHQMDKVHLEKESISLA